jgi:quinol-cytochrome oxidoreductase complex cytochrome b subunit/mono/diheme cytochrome c family protein
VLARLKEWLDHRIGYRKLIDALLIEHIPGGAKWRYVWGSCLAFVFMIQLVTGILLMTAYSPGDSTAWGSVYFIQYQMEFGWLIRGLHHFGSQTMVVLLGIHMLQVVIAGAHLPPREINWWLGLLLLGAVLAMSLTGYLLPWDQKGYWATQVATNIAGKLPGLGEWLKKIIVGGSEYGHPTLTRFYALHVGILPPLILVLIIAHVAVFRRHGVTTPKNAEGEGWFWPDQAFRDLVVSLLIFGAMLGLVVWGGHGHHVDAPAAEAASEATWWDQIALAGRDGRGANLDAPADPARPYPARPEWYFLFLFQLLKYFEGDLMIVGTVIIPNGVGLLLFTLPLFGYGRMRPFGHVLGVVVVVALLTAVASLTCLALADDTSDEVSRNLLKNLAFGLIPATGGFVLIHFGFLALLKPGTLRTGLSFIGTLLLAVLALGNGALLYGALSNQIPAELRSHLQERLPPEEDREDKTKKAKGFQNQLTAATKEGKRAVEMASARYLVDPALPPLGGIPAEGAVVLLQRDPKTRGRELFKMCAACHSYTKDGGGDEFAEPNKEGDKVEPVVFKASDLANFGTEKWIRELLRHPEHPHYFGRTKLKGMTKWAENWRATVKELPKEKADEAERDLDLLAAWLATHPTAPYQRKNKEDATPAGKAFKAFNRHCATCHAYGGDGGSESPDLKGYGSQEWIHLMILSPAHPLRHTKGNTMPAFRPDQSGAGFLEFQASNTDPKIAVLPLSNIERELIVRWMTRDYRVVFGGSPIGPKKKDD